MHNPWWIYNIRFLVPEGMCGSNEISYFLQNDAYFDETTALMLVILRAWPAKMMLGEASSPLCMAVAGQC